VQGGLSGASPAGPHPAQCPRSRPAPPPARCARLLAFLAVHPDGVTGKAISKALWPESPPGRGATQRNLALRKLRDLLRAAAGLTEPMLVTLTAERYRLDPAFITTDVAGFQAALEAVLGHDPFNEYLYQRIMRLQAASGRPDAVRRTLGLLEARLTEIGVTPGSQTRQAAAALLGVPGCAWPATTRL